MPATRVLFVKLSSLGDVVHHLPAVTDLLRHRPGVHVAWAVEEAYAELVRLHPGVAEVIPVGLRGLKRNVLSPARWRGMREARKKLGGGRWDYVIDAQGLIKSALVTRAARAPVFGMDRKSALVTRAARAPVFGMDRKSARERAAAGFYDVRIPVAREQHAVERNRELVAKVFGYRVEGPPLYGLGAATSPPAWAPVLPYAVLLQAASRAEKRWPEDRWEALARRLAQSGCVSVFPGGTEEERRAAARLAAKVPQGLAAPAMGLAEAAALMAHSQLVVGVDTGLTHLGAALGRPTVGIYTATRPQLTGLHAQDARNLGGPGAAPSADEVAAALQLEAA